ncbi:LytTR family DNA-binding domain-containing protein [Hymenobacter sp. 15J16-1T3B]|uniref:LytR/AlgR family response regulator transcription factor n=1 Tax=Hymenobacter sp. 15J16-1T3B TaxID=2886941 RepID=UPI001D128ADB|nr:LytTR family DNA-binding domain-containing protein [Hymenobacter sp. 15J16-1T3B]MCC3158423.1 LytTR family DNA-binding domain-containing protein [Hymenobacter sp. 15J16-1T3B]
MNVLLIEDEQLAAEALAGIIRRLRPQAHIVATVESVEEAVEWLRLHQSPDLLFCDIHLADGNSFAIFRQVEVTCPVIFTTAYNQYAIEAFRVNSIDYLLKPIAAEDVAQALKKHEALQQQHLAQGLGNLRQLVQSTASPATRTRFMVKHGQAMKAVAVDDVAYFYAEEGVVFLVTHAGPRFIINLTLDQLEQELDAKQFFRANRQLIVHIAAVQEVRPYFKGRLSLVLKPASAAEQIVSSSRANAFKQWLDM